MKAIRVLIADDHALVRAGLRSLLEKIPGVEIAGEAATGLEAIERAARTDVVLMDISMAGVNGLEATGRIVRERKAARVIVLSMHDSEEYVLRALRAGAAGYLVKDSATSELELAIRSVMDGKTYLSPSVSRKVVEQVLSGKLAAADGDLTPRQREILQLVAEGKTTKEIAALLHVSVKTVETHRAQLMQRLGIRDIPGLVRHAMKLGLVPPGD